VAKSSSENEIHVVAVRLRVTGSGSLLMTLVDLDNVQTDTLVPFTMAATTRIEPTRLANIQSQRIRFTLSTTVINETFHVRRIILFSKSVAVEYPM
jgi:hypothetical protein